MIDLRRSMIRGGLLGAFGVCCSACSASSPNREGAGDAAAADVNDSELFADTERVLPPPATAALRIIHVNDSHSQIEPANLTLTLTPTGGQARRLVASSLSVPLLSANVDVSDDAELANSFDGFVVLGEGAARVAVIGLTTTATPTMSRGDLKVRFVDPVATLRQVIDAMKERQVERIVVLSHLGISEDHKLIEAVPGIDVVIGGHSHTVMGDLSALGLSTKRPYPSWVKGPDGRVCLVHAWEGTKLVGVLDLRFDDRGVLTECRGKPVMPLGATLRDSGTERDKSADESLPYLEPALNAGVARIVDQDPSTRTPLAPYVLAIDQLRAQQVATVTEDLLHVSVPQTPHASGEEMPLGSHVAPHLAASMLRQSARFGLQADMALINGGAVHHELRAGTLLGADVLRTLPFFNTLVVLELRGADLKLVLEQAVVYGVETNSSGYPYLAGARAEVDLKRTPTERVTAFELLTSDGSYVAVDAQKRYRVVTVDYLANGNAGYAELKKAALARIDTDHTDYRALIDYATQERLLARPTGSEGVQLINP